MKKLLLVAALAGISAVAIAQTTATPPKSTAQVKASPASLTSAGLVVVPENMHASLTAYVKRNDRPDLKIRDKAAIGMVLPEKGVSYFEVPVEYRAGPDYRYTVVNGQVVIVDIRNRQLVQFIK